MWSKFILKIINEYIPISFDDYQGRQERRVRTANSGYDKDCPFNWAVICKR